MATDLEARYGRSPSVGRRGRILAIVAAIGVAAVLTAWVVWGGLLSPDAGIEARVTGTELVSEREIAVTYQLTTAPGEEVSCAVQALNQLFAPVGWKVVDLPASEELTRTLTETVLTTEAPETGLIYRCWPT